MTVMAFYWLLFCFVLLWASLMILQDFDVLGSTSAARFSTRFIFITVVSLFAGYFSDAGSFDYDNYVDLLNEAPPTTVWQLITLKDPFFQLMGFMFRSSDGSLAFLMFFITFISLGLKIIILDGKHYKNIFGLAVVFLLARFFLLHEFTQVRAALGIAFVSISIMYAMENKLVLVVVSLALAVMTHLSTIVLLPAVLLVYQVNAKIKLFIFIFLAVAFSVVISNFDIESFSRISPYLTGEYYVAENTIFSFYFLFKVIVSASLFYQWKSLTPALRHALIISVYGLFLTWFFLKNEVLSLRLGELTAVFDCLCFAYFFKYGLKLDYFYGYLAGIFIAGIFYYSSTNIVNPLTLNF